MEPKRIQMRACRAMTTFSGVAVADGEIFEASPIEAAAYKYQQMADFVTANDRQIDTAHLDTDAPRKRYRRRDLTPEEP